ncbi:MAG: LysR substrate-binding domain-containing protein [Pseudomonadota bacterium]
MEDLRPIRVFLEVAAQSSFVGAAKGLGLTPASVTRIVAKLEADLGQQLLVRTTRQVSLTSAGAVVAARYRPIVEDFDAATRDVLSANRPDSGRLRINAPMSMGVRVLPPLIAGFRLAYPNIALELSLTDKMVDIIEADADLAIRISASSTDKSTIWRKICTVPRRVIAAPSLFDHLPRPTRPEEIDPDHCLSYGDMPEVWTFEKGGQTRSMRAADRFLGNNGDLLFGMVAAGAGMARLPDFIFADGLARGAVEIVLPDWTVPALWLTLYYPPYETLPPLVATFSDYFEAHMRGVAGLDFASNIAGARAL